MLQRSAPGSGYVQVSMKAQLDAAVYVIRANDGRWSWLYREGDTKFAGNSTYGSVEAAIDEAAHAYPGVPVHVEDGNEDTRARGLDGVPPLRRVLVLIAALVVARPWRKKGS